jgi:CheY-like chemotaxis protein
MYAFVLGQEGFVVAEARDGQEGLRKAMQTLPDLIITDINMPVIDGWETIGRLKADDRTGHIPIIVCSGHPQHTPGGPDVAAHLVKPCSPEALRLTVRRLLRRTES